MKFGEESYCIDDTVKRLMDAVHWLYNFLHIFQNLVCGTLFQVQVHPAREHDGSGTAKQEDKCV